MVFRLRNTWKPRPQPLLPPKVYRDFWTCAYQAIDD